MSEVINVPDEWEIDSFKSLKIKLIDGDRGSNYPKDEDFFDQGHCIFLSAKNVTKNGFKFDQLQFINKEKDDKLRKGKLERNDIVLTTRGTVGNISYFNKSVKYNHIRINSGMIILRNENKTLVTDYLYKFLNSNIFDNQIGNTVFGSAQPQLTVKEIEKFFMFFPKEKKEQEKIAKILSTLDTAIESTQKLIDKEKNIKKGLMTDLLQNGIDKNGKIRTPQTHKYKDSELGLIPEEWEVKNIEKIADVFGGGTPSRGDEEFWQNGTIFWATPSDITAIKNSNYIYDTKEKITKKALFGSSTKILPIGSILLTSRATIGERKITKIPICTNQGFTSLIPKNDNGKFIFYLLDKYTNYMYSRAYGTTFPEISRTEVKKMLISLPVDIKEQKQIAKILNIQDKKIEKEEENLAKLKELKKGLMSDLLSGKVRVKV